MKTDEQPDESAENFLKAVASRLREARKKASLTQKQLAEKAEVRQSYIFELEAGGANITIKTLAKMANLLGVDPRDLLPAGTSSPPSREGLAHLCALLERIAQVLEERSAQDDRRRQQEAELVETLRSFADLREGLAKLVKSSGH